MNPFRFLLAPILAFFDLKIYREVRDVKTGASILYLSYLSLIFTFAISVLGFTQIPKVNAFVEWVKTNLPVMTLAQSGMKLEQPGKHEMRHPEFGVLAIFDDSRETVSAEEMGPAVIYVTSKMVYFKKNSGIQSSMIGGQSADKAFSLKVDAALVQKIYDKVKTPLAILFLFFAFLFGLVSRLIGALFFAVMGTLLQSILKKQLSFQSSFNLAAFVLSISFPFSFLQYVPNVARFFPGYLGAVLSSVYLILAIIVQPKVENS